MEARLLGVIPSTYLLIKMTRVSFKLRLNY